MRTKKEIENAIASAESCYSGYARDINNGQLDEYKRKEFQQHANSALRKIEELENELRGVENKPTIDLRGFVENNIYGLQDAWDPEDEKVEVCINSVWVKELDNGHLLYTQNDSLVFVPKQINDKEQQNDT